MELGKLIKLGTMGFKPADVKQLNESGIDSDQIIELAKNGYKAEDVNELIKLASTEPAAQPEQTPKATTPDEALKEPVKKEPDINMEDLQKKIEEQNAIIISLQKQNASKDLGKPIEKTPRDTFRDALKQLY